MVSCPVCGTQNEGDFGLINCTSCGSPFFIQIDGSVEVASSEPAPARASTSPNVQAAAPEQSDDVSQSILDDFQDVNRQGDFESVSRKPRATPPVEEPLFEALPSLDYSSAPPLPESSPGPSATSGENMEDIAAFGNSEQSLAREGAYRFTLTVTGIDSAEIKTEVKDALTDGRFLWDIEALIASMEDGVLIINDLSAVKSALVVQRLKILPVEIKWEQHAIHQSV